MTPAAGPTASGTPPVPLVPPEPLVPAEPPVPPGPPLPTTVVVMGVAGSGKTTIARGFVRRLGWPYAEGDEFHPAANVQKMRAGRPLDDEDRLPWLRALADWIGRQEQSGTSAVVACSALKRCYRDVLRDGHPSVWFVHTDVRPELLRERLHQRRGHFLPAGLLDSQLETFEPLEPDEPGVVVDAADQPDRVVDAVLAQLAPTVGASRPPAADAHRGPVPPADRSQ